MFSWKTTRHFIYGLLAGTAGVKVLSGKTAKKVYTQVTAATLRCVDDVVKTATCIKENRDSVIRSVEGGYFLE